MFKVKNIFFYQLLKDYHSFLGTVGDQVNFIYFLIYDHSEKDCCSILLSTSDRHGLNILIIKKLLGKFWSRAGSGVLDELVSNERCFQHYC